MSVTLLEVMAAAQARRAPLVAELAGYLVLGAADQSAGAPRQMCATDVMLADDGSVRLVGAGTACASDAAERALRGLLSQLMQVASSATPALFRSTQRAAGAGVDALIRELETALIPVNRAAARRALSRLHRETARAIESGRVDVAAFEAMAPGDPQQHEPAPEQPPPRLEPVAAPAPAAPDPEPQEWSVPLAVLQGSPEPPEAELRSGAREVPSERREDETAPEPVVARARAPRPEVVLELSPPVMEVALEPAANATDLAIEVEAPPAEAAALRTPTIGTLCDPHIVQGQGDAVDSDRTDRAPPVFDAEETRPLELDPEPTCAIPLVKVAAGVAGTAELVQKNELLEELDDEDIEWIDVEPSAEPAVCRAGEPFATAPSANPPSVASSWRPSVVVVRGAEADPEPAPPPPEPTPPPRVPGVEQVESAPPRFAPRRSDVSELLAAFAVAETRSDNELRGDLKRIAGLEPTPPPPDAHGSEAADESAADPAACEAR